MGYPGALYNPVVDDISTAALQAKATNDATYEHSTVHQADAAEILATQTKIGTGASTPTAAKVLYGSGTGTSAWSATPTLTDLTLTGDLVVGDDATITDDLAVTGKQTIGETLIVTGAVTHTSTTALTDSATFANAKGTFWKNAAGSADSSIVEDSNDDLVININTAAKNLEVTDSADATKFIVDTNNSFIGAKNGYATRAYETANTKYVSMSHNGTDGGIATSSGNLNLNVASNGDVQVFDKMPRRNYTANTYVDSFMQSGWGYIQGTGAAVMSATVTLPKACSLDNVRIICNSSGSKVGVPSDEGDLNAASADHFIVRSEAPTTTNFRIVMTHETGTFSNTVYYGYSWISVGPI